MQKDRQTFNITITRTTFATNHAYNNLGNDIYIWRNPPNQGAVPCPAPGKGCDVQQGTTMCCLDGDGTWNLTLPSN